MQKGHEVRITGVKMTSLAMFEGLLAAVFGFVVAVIAWIGLTANYTAATNSLLRGLLWGLAPGLLAVIVSTVLYFAVGWVFGLVHGVLFNLVTDWMDGLVIATRRQEDAPIAPAQSQRQGSTRRAEPTFGETIRRRNPDE